MAPAGDAGHPGGGSAVGAARRHPTVPDVLRGDPARAARSRRAALQGRVGHRRRARGSARLLMTTTGGTRPVGGVAGQPSLVALRSVPGVSLIAASVLASMAGFLDASVVNVAVPAISSDLGTSLVALQWSLTGYLLTA